MPADVFISYASQDVEFVTQLHQALTRRSYSVWFDKDNENQALLHRVEVDKQIQACQVFILVLSPDAAAASKVAEELGRAQDHHARPVIALKWHEPVQVPVSMQPWLDHIEQQLDFAGETTPDNFDQLDHLLKSLIDQRQPHAEKPLVQAKETGKKQIIQSKATEPSITQAPSIVPSSSGRRLGALSNKSAQKKSSIDPVAIGGVILANVVTPLDLTPPTQAFIEAELKWLFAAADNFLKIRHGEIDPSQPITLPVPPEVQKHAQANNQLLLSNVETLVKDWKVGTLESNVEYKLEEWQREIEQRLTRQIEQIYLKQLNILLAREAGGGEAKKSNPYLQSQIKDQRIAIVKEVQQLAQIMNDAYGILITAPDQLLQFLEQTADILAGPTALGGVISASFIPTLGLGPEDEGFIKGELKWLFSAADNLLTISRKLAATGEIDLSQPVAVPIPPDAEITSSEANNHLLSQPDELKIYDGFEIMLRGHYRPGVGYGGGWQQKVETQLKTISYRLNNLNLLLDRETELGEAGKSDIQLQRNIKDNGISLFKILQDLAGLMNKAYGIRVTSPGQLVELLEES